jgi:hypothetical protein
MIRSDSSAVVNCAIAVLLLLISLNIILKANVFSGPNADSSGNTCDVQGANLDREIRGS